MSTIEEAKKEGMVRLQLQVSYTQAVQVTGEFFQSRRRLHIDGWLPSLTTDTVSIRSEGEVVASYQLLTTWFFLFSM